MNIVIITVIKYCKLTNLPKLGNSVNLLLGQSNTCKLINSFKLGKLVILAL